MPSDLKPSWDFCIFTSEMNCSQSVAISSVSGVASAFGFCLVGFYFLSYFIGKKGFFVLFSWCGCFGWGCLFAFFSFSLTIDFFSFREFALKSFALMQSVRMSTL